MVYESTSDSFGFNLAALEYKFCPIQFHFFHVLHFGFTDLEGRKEGERWHVTKTTSLNVIAF